MKTRILPDRSVLGVLGLACCVGVGTTVPVLAQAKPQTKPQQAKPQAQPAAQTQAAQAKPEVKIVASATMTERKPLPRYLPLEDINALRALRGKDGPPPVLQPLFQGRALNGDHVNLATGSATLTQVAARVAGIDSLDGMRLAQAMPQPVPPAAIPASARVAVPKWVRYPLEFQLGGIGLGTLAVNKDQFNRIDRYGLFAIHGNPTAVVVPTGGGTVMQTPEEVASLFPSQEFGALPAWASAVAVDLDRNHVQWLYRRETYAMGFVVDRLGYVDAIVVAGIESPANTQLEDPVHTIKLGDDLRKVLFRYGYPDNIGTGKVAVAGAGAPTAAAAPAEGADPTGVGALPGAPGEPGAEGEAAAGLATGNAAFRTFEFSYEQSYNISFTIRDNRVVRMYIFGDPEFFNDQRRQLLRTRY